jgi:hypothetical protein
MELRRYSHPDSLLELELQVQELLDRAVAPRLGVIPHQADGPNGSSSELLPYTIETESISSRR